MNNDKLSVIIPVYNEADTLPEIVRRVLAVDIGMPLEVILVDDCSRDSSAEVIATLSHPSLKKVYLSSNVGKGGAIKEGLTYVTGSFVIFQDADLEYDPQDYGTLLHKLGTSHYTVVMGNRFTPENRKYIKNTLFHYIGNQFLRLIFSVLYLRYVPDAEPCYKLFRTSELRELHVVSDRFEYDIELMCKLAKKGFTFLNCSISYSPRSREEGKKISWKDGLIALRVMVLERFR